MNIMPSTPRFKCPTFSLKISPTVPNRKGVPANTAATRNLITISLLMRVYLLFREIQIDTV